MGTISGKEPETPKSDFVYYTDRRTWTEEADIDSTRSRLRWQERDKARWDEEQRQISMIQKDKELAEEVRREVFGEALEGPTEAEEESGSGDEESEDTEHEVEPLPSNRPVVPIILKAKSMSQ